MTNKVQRKTKSTSFKISLPSDFANLDIIRNFVSKIARQMGFDEDDIYKIELSVDEACTNVVRHAYKGVQKNQKMIDVRVSPKHDRIEISIIDHGRGFDPEKIPLPDMEEYRRRLKRGGLGIFLMKSLMDRVIFKIQPGKRNEVKLIKYLPRKKS